MSILLSIVQILLCMVLISVVLMHKRKQGGFAGIFGGGTRADMGQWQRFNELTKITVVIFIIYILLSAVLVLMSK